LGAFKVQPLPGKASPAEDTSAAAAHEKEH